MASTRQKYAANSHRINGHQPGVTADTLPAPSLGVTVFSTVKHRLHQSQHRIAALNVPLNPASKRRSTRMALSAPVGLSGQDLQTGSFTISAKAVSLNKHGAAVQINRELPIGSTIIVRNQRGAQLTARVVNQVRAIGGVRTFGIEFLEQDEHSKQFWGISFPSS
jgi:hypothetical protein